MATAKKKTSAKRTAKKVTSAYAKGAKTAAAAARHATSHATQASNDWMKDSAAEWQSKAQDWAKQSAKMYQFPFGQNDAAEAAKSATSGMMNFAQQMFDQTKNAGYSSYARENFNPQDAQEKFSRFARESAEQLNKTAGSAQYAMEEAMEIARENGEVFVEVSNMAVTVSKEMGAEMISYCNKLFAQNVEMSKQVLSCRTLNDLFDLSSQMTKANLDAFFSESVKLSEKLFQCATECSEPLNERMSETTERMSKVLAA